MDSPSQTTCLLAVVTVIGRNMKQRPNLKVLQPRSSEGWPQNFFTRCHSHHPSAAPGHRPGIRQGSSEERVLQGSKPILHYQQSLSDQVLHR